jgi:hypothetical protein
VTQGDADYDAVRAELVWNGDIDRRPWAIARALSADDVAVAVKFARASGRELSVRGGGHNFSGSCIADGAIMIDLGALSAVSVDPVAKTARCGGGTRLVAAGRGHPGAEDRPADLGPPRVLVCGVLTADQVTLPDWSSTRRAACR